MTLATLAMLVAGIVALATGIPLDVAGLFLITAAPCALVTVSLYLVAVRGRGGEVAVASQAVASQAVASQADESQAQEPQDEEPTAEPEPAATTADE
jgi:UPF0716 family protein affecting phage T7 exclusion